MQISAVLTKKICTMVHPRNEKKYLYLSNPSKFSNPRGDCFVEGTREAEINMPRTYTPKAVHSGHLRQVLEKTFEFRLLEISRTGSIDSQGHQVLEDVLKETKKGKPEGDIAC